MAGTWARHWRLASRASPLARLQAERVGKRLVERGLAAGFEVVGVSTAGDRAADVPIAAMGGQGVFVTDVRRALLDGRADAAVHSAKDLPSAPCPGLVLAAVPERADPRDCLVGRTLAELGPGAPVATGSVRRRAQLAHLRPDLTFTSLRGNIATRLAKVPTDGAAVVAYAALLRLGIVSAAVEVLATWQVLPQAGQGALAVECREDDLFLSEALGGIDDTAAHRELDEERAFLAALGGGCDAPVGALARALPDGSVEVEGLLATADGREVLRHREVGGWGGGGGEVGTVGRQVAAFLISATSAAASTATRAASTGTAAAASTATASEVEARDPGGAGDR